MSFRRYEPPRIPVHDGTDVLQRNPYIVGKQQLVPRMAKKARAASRVDPREFFLFSRKINGRRCSCWIGGETDAEGYCPICYGTGVVGGYDKWGTARESIDWSSSRLTCVGVVPNFMLKHDTRPVTFMLDEGVTTGYVEASFNLRPNVNKLDLLQVNTVNITNENSVKPYIMTEHDGVWIPLDRESLTARLYLRSEIKIRIVLSRKFAEIDSPIFVNLSFRYNLRDDLLITADIPRREESVAFSEYGIADAFNTINLFVDDTVKSVSTFDFFVRVDDGTRWKIVSSTPNEPLGILTNHDLVCRLVQSYEPYSIIP